MKLNRSILTGILTITFLNIDSALAEETPIRIDQVIAGPQKGDKPTNFSLNINLKNVSDSSINNWQLGFYMPRNFQRTSKSNLRLTMKICEKNTKHCSSMDYLKPPFRKKDLSSVFTTIIAPSAKFALQSGKTYTISLLHNSSRGPQNYSSLPQSFFLVTPNETYALTTKPGTYQITNYDSKSVKEKIEAHIAQNWNSTSGKSPITIVIPTPESVNLTPGNGKFLFNKSIKLHDLSGNNDGDTQLWVNALKQDLDLKVSLDNKKSNDGIRLEKNTDDYLKNPEAYNIIITTNQVLIKASTQAGFFYALQTLRQMWHSTTSLTAMEINDSPRFKYRGILLDVARHYFTVDQLENFIDIMASAKLNTLHLHLSDDEGFRLNLPNYPTLASIGSSRGLQQQIGPMALQQQNLSQANTQLPAADTIYSGSYSESDIKDLIHYANLRQITIIPEIDIPGHSRAMMKALPNAFHEKNDTSEYVGYGNNTIPVCAFRKDSELGQIFTKTLTDILYQTAQMFNNQTTAYNINNELSIGGDEVYKGAWDKSPSCQTAPWNAMNSLQKEHYFLDSLNNSSPLNKLRLSGWHEFVLEPSGSINKVHGVKASEIGHVWVWGKSSDSINKAVNLANNNYPVVLSYSDLLYLDMTYTPNLSEPGFYWANRFGDTEAALTSAKYANLTLDKSTKSGNILGLEGSLWADTIPDYNQLQYMALPKLAGLAEASWSSSTKTVSNGALNWQSLAIRLGCGQSGYLAYLNEVYGANYRGYPNGIKREAPQLCK